MLPVVFRVPTQLPSPLAVTTTLIRRNSEPVPVCTRFTTNRSPALNPQLVVQLVLPCSVSPAQVLLGQAEFAVHVAPALAPPAHRPLNVTVRSLSVPVVTFLAVNTSVREIPMAVS